MNLIASWYPNKHFLFSKTSSRRLQRNNFLSSKTSSRRICNTSSKNVFKTSSRRFQDHFARRLQDIFKTSYKTKNVTLKTSSRCLQDVSTKTNICWDGSSQLSETNGIRKNILLRRSNMVLLRYLRQMKYGKTFY